MKKKNLILAVGLSLACVFGAGACEAAAVPQTSESIQYFGRWDKGADAYRCAQGATYIKANFTGTSLYADLTGPNDWWRVSIDGGEFRRFRPRGAKTMLAENLQPGQHSVLLVRSTEGYMGLSEFRGFILEDGAVLTTPDPLKERRLEFVGDSITAGAKNDGAPNKPYNNTEDNDMAFGPQLARLLDADYSVLGKSGEGVIHNWAESWPGHEVHTADRYQWVFYSDKFSPENKAWDTKDFPVDGVVIAIGTNDFSDTERKPTEEEFTAGYKNLVETVRRMNPEAEIICTEPVPSWVGENVRQWISSVVDGFNAAGDTRVHYIALNADGPLLEESDYAGDSTHPLKDGSKKIAAYLKDKVAKIMGWL